MQTKLAIFTFLLSFGLLILGAAPKSEKYEKLLKTTQEKKTGILEFSGDTIEKYLKSSRDYSIILLLTTEKTSRIDCQLCPHVNMEFANAVQQFKDELGSRGYSSDKFSQRPVFFGRCDIMSCMEFYKAGGYKTFPMILHIRPSAQEVSAVDYRKIDKIDEIYEDPSSDIMITHISRLTGHHFVREVPMYRNIIQYGGGAVLLIVIVKVLFDQLRVWSKNQMIWFAACVCVFAIVMAGTVFNSIHSPGLWYRNPATKQLMLIYPSTRHQFIIEGVIMAALFTLAGLFFVGFTSHVPTFKDPWKQRGMFCVCGLGFYTCFYWIMTIFKVKHGYYPYW